VRTENIPFDDKFIEAYEDYVHKCKMKFTIKVYPRKRKICTKFPNWFDYNVPDNTAIEVKEDDLYSVVGKDTEYDENKLINLALSRLLRSREFLPDTVLEITHSDKQYIYIIGEDKKCDRLDNEKFRRIPFDFDNIWTTVCEWSRDKKLCKKIIDGKTEVVISPESEWEKIQPQDREYAKRLIEEQIRLKEEQLSKNKLMQKLCELKSNAESELKAKQAHEDKVSQQKADLKNSKNNRKGGVNS
jgi:hypothetical protein